MLLCYCDGSTTWTNTYNADGLRTRRTNGTSAYSYVYNGSSLVQMTVDGNTLYFTYDASGVPQTVTHNGTTYYYATNLQGDITAILNASGTAVVKYTYDAWGNHTSGSNGTGTLATTLGRYNPLRYRGYVFDAETSLYYLQSRYYNPAIGRFINADALVSTGQGLLGNNMFAYCLNNPANHSDPAGDSAVAEGLKGGLLALPLMDGPIPLGDFIAVIGFIAVLLYEQSHDEDIVSSISSDSIDWGAGGKNRKNHIIKGTKGKHVNGWKRFGIDPDNNNAWGSILLLLEEVVDDADYYVTTALPGGAMYIQYFKTYIDQGVQVVVKIWVDATGTIQQISDAIPYIID